MTTNLQISTILPRKIAIFLAAILALVPAACNRSAPAPKTETTRYHLKGKIVSIDLQAGEATIDAEDIPGFMDAMIMPYKIKDQADLKKLKPGDSVTADVVGHGQDYWLENVKVTASSPTKPAATLHYPAPGDPVPDFEFLNQSGKHIRLKQFAGKTVLLTFIYTRCPFPDFCPRVTHQFAQIESQLKATPALYAGTRLLSISFDPTHDTPKVLRDYGFANSGTKNPTLFAHWQFASSPQAQLPTLANFFGLIYKDDDGVITHSLSTAMVGPDGRIVKWYHGSDWQTDQVMTDLSESAHAPRSQS